jgi:hypothetical protein
VESLILPDLLTRDGTSETVLFVRTVLLNTASSAKILAMTNETYFLYVPNSRRSRKLWLAFAPLFFFLVAVGAFFNHPLSFRVDHQAGNGNTQTFGSEIHYMAEGQNFGLRPLHRR